MARQQELSPAEVQREREMLRELQKFHRGASEPLATQLALKRLRVPRVDADTNPFCMDRQLADEYERMNFNKNPRFYTITLDKPALPSENPRNYSSFINQTADRLASSGVSPRARAEFSSKRPAPSYEPPVVQFSAPEVISVDPSNLRRSGNNSASPRISTLPPSHEQYGVHLTKQTVSFGHRPGSGGRMYDCLTDSISGPGGAKLGTGSVALPAPSMGSTSSRRSSSLSTSVKTGMSVMALAQLLAPPKSNSKGTKGSSSTSSAQFDEGDDDDFNDDGSDQEDETGTITDEEMQQRRHHRRARREQQRKKKELEALERNYKNAVFNPPRAKKEPRFLPPSDQSTGQLIDKYRKLAVGKLPGADESQDTF